MKYLMLQEAIERRQTNHLSYTHILNVADDFVKEGVGRDPFLFFLAAYLTVGSPAKIVRSNISALLLTRGDVFNPV
jgi:hypothetical protein